MKERFHKGKACAPRAAVLLFLAVCLLLTACMLSRTAKPAGPELTAALYPYVPDPARFEQAVLGEWTRLHPDIPLRFVSWDCYQEDPPAGADVFVFDTIFLTRFVRQGSLLPLSRERIPEAEDLFAFALDGCTADGALYAVPQLLCTNLLYTRKEDSALADIRDIESLYEKLGPCQVDIREPEPGKGLLIDMSGGTGKVSMYLDALMDVRQAYTGYDELPESFSPEAVLCLKRLVEMGGREQTQFYPDSGDAYLRARWFASGIGRAYIGYTEAMSAMDGLPERLDLRVFSFTKEPNIPVFFCDAAGIRSDIGREKRAYALELLSVLTGTEALVRAIEPPQDGQAPQYLLPARKSAYERLRTPLPVYGQLQDIVSCPENHLFRLGEDCRAYLSGAKKALPDLLFTEAGPA